MSDLAVTIFRSQFFCPMPRPMLFGEPFRQRDTVLLEDHIPRQALVRFCFSCASRYSDSTICIPSKETHRSSNISPKVDWHLEVTRDIDNPTWTILYTFSENEFFIPDYASASFSVSTVPKQTIFWSEVLLVKHFLLSDEE